VIRYENRNQITSCQPYTTRTTFPLKFGQHRCTTYFIYSQRDT